MIEAGTAATVHAEVGDELPVVHRMVTRDGIDAYRKASGDNNRIHYDDEFAAATRFGGVIAHGMLTLALVSEMMTQAYGTDWLTTGSLRVRFRGAAHPGDTLEVSGAVSRVETTDQSATITCNVAVNNSQSNERIITGTASLVVETKQQGAAP